MLDKLDNLPELLLRHRRAVGIVAVLIAILTWTVDLTGLVAYDPLRGEPPDLLQRLKAIDRPPPQAHRPSIDRIREEAKRLARALPTGERDDLSPAQMAALAYPDRIGLRRKGDEARYVLSGGKGAVVAAGDPLGRGPVGAVARPHPSRARLGGAGACGGQRAVGGGAAGARPDGGDAGARAGQSAQSA